MLIMRFDLFVLIICTYFYKHQEIKGIAIYQLYIASIDYYGTIGL